jgi:hypothetical protein
MITFTMPRWEEDVKRLKANDPSLTSLNLYNKIIGVDGAKAIAEALKVNTVLTELGLFNNSIGDDLRNDINKFIDAKKNRKSLEEYVKRLKANDQSLTTLSLKGNSILMMEPRPLQRLSRTILS